MLIRILAILALSVCVVILIGCKDEDGRNYLDNLSYGFDPRTEMCFAYGIESGSNIPCSENVLTLTEEHTFITYYIDIKTEYCFALSGKMLARVECTDKVRKLIRE